ncbi:hypothetical protein [Thalassoroseus pseudoceratinae]|uniref:hypothetical protein n=1 Tax=Thalassoroseus pseudoceratinae TaxID=2713176 RepID=UPI001981E9D5|nr:hypothetical protein [Thalassoroseus pseudoceratinae]
MPMDHVRRIAAAMAATWIAGSSVGCSYATKCYNMGDFTPSPQGTISDPVWQQQEANAEASDFVIHEHEWTSEGVILNRAGMDHLKKIAARGMEVPFSILVERSSMGVDPNSKYGYPVNSNHGLDMARRAAVVEALASMGITDAEERVYVSPALAPGFEGNEAENAYRRGYSGGRGNGFGFGGFFGGGGGFGGFGGGGFGF